MIKLENLLKSLDEYGIKYELDGDVKNIEKLINKLNNIVEKMKKEINK